MEVKNKATKISLFNFSTPQMRAFHMSWFSFFLCFFAWFGIAPLMVIVRDELNLTKTQIGNTIIASVAITIIARLIIGRLCDKYGPRLTYTFLLILGSIPVMSIGFARTYETFLLFRLGIGAIGAAFVITQYHTSVMFAPNCVGTANATSAGWGNLGGGVTQMIMPLIFSGFIALGYTNFWSWRLSMVVAGAICMLTGVAYFFLTTDLPDGNFKELGITKRQKEEPQPGSTFLDACKDRRVWMLFLVYAACFGVELTLNNIAALYFKDYFGLGVRTAGLVAGLFGLMNIFARTTGGIIGDKFGLRWGLKGRVRWLFIALFVEAVALLFFSQIKVLPIAIGVMVIFSLFVQMSEGATYSVVPFINKKALGSVSGIVGAGGNMGAVAAGFLFRSPDLTWPEALFILGIVVACLAFSALFVTFSEEDERIAKADLEVALKERARLESAEIKKSFSLPAILTKVQAMDFLRVFLGGALAIKGIYFILNMQEIEVMTGGITEYSNIIGWFVILAHIVGGVALSIGFGTRMASLVNIPVLLGAIFFVHAGQGLFSGSQDLQFSLLVLVCLLSFVWSGSGKFSLDYVLKPKEE